MRECVLCALIYLLVLQVCNCLEHLTGWNYINLHCRDNNNSPVDWWYIYKPASDNYYYSDRGRNFSFITPSTAGRWQASDKYISSGSMLQHTLSPLFRPTYLDYLAVVAYDERKPDRMDQSSAVLGIMMADESSGFWLGHTVPGLLDLTQHRPVFPEEELKNGHLIMCFSLDLVTLNKIATLIKQTASNIKLIRVPNSLRYDLPGWYELQKEPNAKVSRRSDPSAILEFLTRELSLRVMMLTRPPGDTECIYNTFAKLKQIILDVYGDHPHHNKSLCQRSYGVRSIPSISLKYPTEVYYQNNKTDRIGFAVSTAAHWQRVGRAERQYWVCTSSPASDDSIMGGLLTCVEDFNVWATFDNLKVKEPEC